MKKINNAFLILTSIILAILMMAVSGIVALIGATAFTALFIYGFRKLYLEAKEEIAEIKIAEGISKMKQERGEPK